MRPPACWSASGERCSDWQAPPTRVATLQPDAHFGRILAAYGGVFVAGSLVWGMVADGFRPDRYDVAAALICLVGVAVIMYAPRAAA
ncbi:YnfA family protein [Nocardioides palaemonis]|uniref:YnfA family protein n=1 Tax=Nocardioides palaemonis TaxID=2829810 RepID=UPI0027DE5BB4|nr:YnfA family protein [Nocardioides palaemonis]